MAIRLRNWFGNALMASMLLAAACGGEIPVGEPGPAGPPGTDGTDGVDGTTDPSVNGITPGRVFLGRSNKITVSGYGTAWTDATTVDFGDGVAVSSLNLASPTALIADVTTSQTATLGARDVTVSDAEGAVTYAGAFDVQAPLELTGTLGTVAQGSIIQVRASQRDTSTPFDISGGDPWDALVIYNGGLTGIVTDATPFTVDGLLFVDVTAPTGATELGVDSGLGNVVTSVQPGALNVAARTAEALTPNAVKAGMVTQPLETHLYELTVQPNNVAFVNATSANPAAAPGFIVLDSGGSFSNLIAFTGSWAVKAGASAETYYIVYWDNSGEANYSYDLNVVEEPSDEVDPNDACGMAQPVASVPTTLNNLTLSSVTDEDWFEVTALPEHVGYPIVVNTTPGEATTDTWVDVVSADCTTSLGGPSSDADYHESFESAPIPAAGTYYVRVYHSSFPYAGALYNLSIAIPVPSPEMEPNDDSSTANATTVDGMLGAVGVSGDNDWYSISLNAGDTLTATVDDGATDVCGPAGSIDSEIEIYDAAVTSLAFNDDIPQTSYCSSASTVAAAAGTYYIRVSSSVQYTPNGTFDYSLLVDVQ